MFLCFWEPCVKQRCRGGVTEYRCFGSSSRESWTHGNPEFQANVQLQALQSIVNQWTMGPVDQWTSGPKGSWTRGLVALQPSGTRDSWRQTHRGARPNGPVGLAPPSGIHKHVLSMRCGAAPLVQFTRTGASLNSQSRSGICGDTCVPTGARRGLGKYCRNDARCMLCSIALQSLILLM